MLLIIVMINSITVPMLWARRMSIQMYLDVDALMSEGLAHVGWHVLVEFWHGLPASTQPITKQMSCKAHASKVEAES
jgi:hypothetical protein